MRSAGNEVEGKKSRERSRGKKVEGKKSRENSRAVHELAYATGCCCSQQFSSHGGGSGGGRGRGGWLEIVVSTNKSRVVINHDFSLRLGDFRQNLGKN